MKNKKLIIISIVALIVLVILSVIVLYFTTDLFKSNKDLFFKYIAKTEVVNSNFITTYSDMINKIEKNNSSSNMDISISTSNENQEEAMKGLVSIKANGLKNTNTNQYYNDFTISSDNENLITLILLRDNNVYGLGANTILKKYISIENSNLKDFSQKLGVTDTGSIPDSIPNNYDEILKIDENTFNTIKEKYVLLIYNNINNDNFNILKNADRTKTFTLSLTEQQTVNLLKTILDSIKGDTTILNLITSKAQLLGYRDVKNEEIQKQIQDIIDSLSKNTYSNDDEYLKFSFVKEDNTIKKINLQIKNKENVKEENKFNISNEDSKNTTEHKYEIDIDISKQGELNVLLKDNDLEVSKIIFAYSYNADTLNSEVNIKNSDNTEINVKHIINNYQTENLTEKTDIIYSYNSSNGQINISNNINFKQDVQIEKLTTENSVILNNMTVEELNNLFTAIVNRVMSVYGININNLSL